MLGRGTRLFPGKSDCLILDVVGVSTRHTLQTATGLFECDTDVSSDLKLLCGGQAQNVSVPLSVFFLNM